MKAKAFDPIVFETNKPYPIESQPVRLVPPNPWEVAMRELAIETGVDAGPEPDRLKTSLILHRCDRESRLRQFEIANGIQRDRIAALEGANRVLRDIEVPELRDLRDAAREERDDALIDASAWRGRAVAAERRIPQAIAWVAALAMVAVASLAVTVHLLIERTTR